MDTPEELVYEEEIEDYVEFRPTLVVGLGGTGHEVVVRLKARLIQTFGDEIFRVVKLRAFDTANESVVVPTETGQLVRLDRDSELINIGNVPVQDIIDNIDRHPAIKAWLPEELSVIAITAGAKQIRPLGRLALFYHYQGEAQVRRRLQAVLASLCNVKLKGAVGDRAEVATTRGVNVFIICSLCGGTGSGTFLDMAYLIRQILQNNGIPLQSCFVTGVLVLPQAFAIVDSGAIMANAYAALQELNHYYLHEFSATYPGGNEVKIRFRPFNICYLVDAVNEHGRSFSGLPELAPMIAESVFLQIGSQVGQALSSTFDNVRILRNTDRSEPPVFSGLGMASLVFPAKRIIETCAYRFGQQLIQKGVLKESDGKPDQQAKEFTERAQLIPRTLTLELSRDPQGRPILVRLQATELGQIKVEDVVRDTDRLLQMYETRRLNTDFKKATDQNIGRMKAQISQMLREETIRLTDDPAHGPRFASAFLARFGQRLHGLLDGFDRQRRQITDGLNRENRALSALYDGLKNAASSFAIGRPQRVRKARDEYVEAKQRQFAGQFEVRKCNMAINLLSHLNAEVAELSREVNTLIDKFGAIEGRFVREAREREQESGQMRLVLSSDVTTLRDVDRYYHLYAREAAVEYTRFLTQVGSLFALGAQSESIIGRSVFGFAQEMFQPIENETIEDIIRQKRAQVGPEQRLAHLRDASVPFWNLEVARMASGGDLELIQVIGVEDATSSLYRDLIRQREQLASTRDPHCITMLHTKHGLPIYALRQIDLYRSKYRDHIRGQVSPLHLFPEFRQPEEEAKQWFALGQAFGYIEKSGVWYYCQPKDELDQRIRLEQGLEKSLRQFVHNTELVTDIAKMIEDKIRDIGNERAMEILNVYLDLQQSRDQDVADTELELRKLAREFRRWMESG